MGAHGWVAGIASHGSVSLSRGWLISVEAPRHPRHLSSIQLDAVVNNNNHNAMFMQENKLAPSQISTLANRCPANILTSHLGFQDKLLYLVLFSLYPSLFGE